MPVATLGCEFFAAPFLETHTKLVAENVKGIAISNSGHWIVQENTAETLSAMKDFFISK